MTTHYVREVKGMSIDTVDRASGGPSVMSYESPCRLVQHVREQSLTEQIVSCTNLLDDCIVSCLMYEEYTCTMRPSHCIEMQEGFKYLSFVLTDVTNDTN